MHKGDPTQSNRLEVTMLWAALGSLALVVLIAVVVAMRVPGPADRPPSSEAARIGLPQAAPDPLSR